MPFGEVPRDVDPETHLAVARSFYLARMARLGLLLAFAVAFVVIALLSAEPAWAVALFGALVLLVGSSILRTQRTWRRAQADARSGPTRTPTQGPPTSGG